MSHGATRRLLHVRDTIDRDYAAPLDVEALAALAHMSRAHFIRRFREAFGETPHRYLQRRRLERAMALLRDTRMPVTEICLEVGFTSLGTFSRTFREVLGISPRAYRRRARPDAWVPACVAMVANRPTEHLRRRLEDDPAVA